MSVKTPNHELSPMRCPVNLEDVDLFSPGAQEHWYEAYDILHRHAAVHCLRGEGFMPGTDGYILSKHEDIELVVKNWERFPPIMSVGIEELTKQEADLEELDYNNATPTSVATLRPNPRLWRAHRQELTDPWVGTGAGRHEEMIKRFANQLIDDWINKGEVEFIGEFARLLPQMVMSAILGFPLEDLKRLEEWGNAQVMPFVYGKGHRNRLTAEQAKEQAEVLDGFNEYVHEKVKEKRANPQDDMVSDLTQITYKALDRCTSSDPVEPFDPISKRHFSAGDFSSLTC